MNETATGRSSGLMIFLNAFPWKYHSGLRFKKWREEYSWLIIHRSSSYSYGDSAGLSPASLFIPGRAGEPVARRKCKRKRKRILNR
jgi:hypothetical protein